MPTEMELTLEQTQQGVSYEVSVFTMKMEILLEPTSNKLMVERFNTTVGNPVKKILLKLNLSDHRSILMDSKTSATLIPDEVLKLKNFKKDATLKLSKSPNQERYKHVGTKVAGPQDGKVTRWRKEICALVISPRCSRSQRQIQVQGTSSIQISMITNQHTHRRAKRYEQRLKNKA
ncbi:hypothetical protein Tco_0827277 [Tanacetum coccineum]